MQNLEKVNQELLKDFNFSLIAGVNDKNEMQYNYAARTPEDDDFAQFMALVTYVLANMLGEDALYDDFFWHILQKNTVDCYQRFCKED